MNQIRIGTLVFSKIVPTKTEKRYPFLLDHLTEAQRRAFMIADNRLTEIAVWDDRLLAEQLKELASVDLDFDIEATGFDLGEIDFRIESLSASEPSRRFRSSPDPPSVRQVISGSSASTGSCAGARSMRHPIGL
ncbi:MAG: hypothetical protein WA231_19930 [Methylocella sp.]